MTYAYKFCRWKLTGLWFDKAEKERGNPSITGVLRRTVDGCIWHKIACSSIAKFDHHPYLFFKTKMKCPRLLGLGGKMQIHSSGLVVWLSLSFLGFSEMGSSHQGKKDAVSNSPNCHTWELSVSPKNLTPFLIDFEERYTYGQGSGCRAQKWSRKCPVCWGNKLWNSFMLSPDPSLTSCSLPAWEPRRFSRA